MSDRMSVLSRRLGRFAVGFSFATLAFLIGLFVAAKTEGHALFFFGGLVSVCLLATFSLWLAHGFAWAMIPEEPVVAEKPAEATKPAAAKRSAEAMKPAEATGPAATTRAAEAKRPAEAMKPLVAEKPAEAMKPAEALRPAETAKAVEATRPAETMKAAEEKKPAEEKVILPENPRDAKYTITGRRIS